MQSSTKGHFMNYSIVTWDAAVNCLKKLFTDNFLCGDLNRTNDQTIEVSFVNQFQINSLFHNKFSQMLGEEKIKQLLISLEHLDFESPNLYNLGRNSSSDIAFTNDFRFALKTITANNYFHFKKGFSNGYFNLMEESNPILAKMYGVYQIQIAEQDYKPLDPDSMEHKRNNRMYFILMENLFHELPKQNITFVFDLKGAVTNREIPGFDTSLEEFQKKGAGLVKGKDLDFVKLKKEENPFNKLSIDDRKILLSQIEKECQILNEAHIMDYSLMLIVSNPNEKCQIGNKSWRNLEMSDGGQLTMGIIDYLQEYNSSKFIERKFKQLFGIFKENNIISCCDNENYQSRFIEFCKKIILDTQ